MFCLPLFSDRIVKRLLGSQGCCHKLSPKGREESWMQPITTEYVCPFK